MTSLRDLFQELRKDNVFNGAAALGFYLTLAIFPTMISVARRFSRARRMEKVAEVIPEYRARTRSPVIPMATRASTKVKAERPAKRPKREPRRREERQTQTPTPPRAKPPVHHDTLAATGMDQEPVG